MALQGSIVTHTLLSAPGSAATAIGFYRDRLAAAAEPPARLSRLAYAEQESFRNHPFWQARAACAPAPPSRLTPRFLPRLDEPLTLSPAAALTSTPCIIGDLVLPHPA